MKNLIVCTDGTWNKPTDKTPSNVYKLYNMLEINSDEQTSYYDSGVGSGNWQDRLTGGILGEGIIENVFQAYSFIARNYKPGDRIFLFGFSRGAFTARSISGMLKMVGIVKLQPCQRYYENNRFKTCEENSSSEKNWCEACKANNAPLQTANALYSKRHKENKQTNNITQTNTTTQEIADDKPQIKMIGVWDTVGALGFPQLTDGIINYLISKLTSRKFFFLNTDFNSLVQYGYHALSIDERRKIFKPILWNKESVDEANNGLTGDDRRVIQAWFPGVHSNVGGGYTDQSLSDVSLKWMIAKAKKHGVIFNEKSHVNVVPDPKGRLDNSSAGFWGFGGSHTRPIESGADIHTSAYHRMTTYVGYKPVNLPGLFHIVE